MPTKTKKTVSAKTFSLAHFLPVPQLKLAYVGKVDDREGEMVTRLGLNSGQKLTAIATLVRDLSLKQCFFCGTESHPQMKKAVEVGDWNLLPLCACLSTLRRGYREYIPNWRAQVTSIAAKVDAGDMDPTLPVYSDTCSAPNCGKTFTITTGKIANAVRKWGRHEQAHRCKACIDAARATQKQPGGANGAPRKPTSAENILAAALKVG